MGSELTNGLVLGSQDDGPGVMMEHTMDHLADVSGHHSISIDGLDQLGGLGHRTGSILEPSFATLHHPPPPSLPARPSQNPRPLPVMQPIIRTNRAGHMSGPGAAQSAPSSGSRPGTSLGPSMSDHVMEIPCPMCPSFRASSVLGIISHFIEQHPDARSQCRTCGRVFTTRDLCRRHERDAHGARDFTCSYCGRVFARRERLTVHVRTHTGERPFECSECGRSFKKKEHLFSHLRHMHGTPDDTEASMLVSDAKTLYLKKV